MIGFVDDNPRLRRRRVHGVHGARHRRDRRACSSDDPDIVLVTIPDAPRERLDVVVRACAEADVDCRFVRREIDLDPRVVLGAASAE